MHERNGINANQEDQGADVEDYNSDVIARGFVDFSLYRHNLVVDDDNGSLDSWKVNGIME